MTSSQSQQSGAFSSRSARSALLTDAIATLAFVLLSAFFLNTPVAYQRIVHVGVDDREIIAGMHPAEQSAEDGRYFRWTTGMARIRFALQGRSAHLLTLRLAAPQAGETGNVAAEIRQQDHLLASLSLTAQPRVYQTLLDSSLLNSRENDITINSATFQAAGDPRQLGVALFEARLQASDSSNWLIPLQVAALGLAILLLLLALRDAGVGFERIVIALLFVLISLSMRQSDPRFVERWDATMFALIVAGASLVAWVALRVFREPIAMHSPTPPDGATPDWRLWLGILVIAIVQFDVIWPGLNTLIPGLPGDNFEYVWKLQWVVKALAQRHTMAFVPQIYFPVGYELAHSEMTPAHTLLGAPITLLAGPTVSYNFLLIISYILTAGFTALLALRMGTERLGAFVAAIGVSFCLYRFARAQAHLPMMGTQWIVLALYGLEGFIQRRRPRDAMVMSLGAALAAWSSWYYGVTLPLLLALWLLLRWPWRETRAMLAAWRSGIAALLVLLALLLPYAQPYMQLRENSQVRHDLATLRLLSAQPVDYLVPSDANRLWSQAIVPLRADANGERRMTAAFGLMILAAAGLWRWRRRGIAWALAGAGAASLIFSFGPNLELGAFSLPLPARWLYEYAPLLDSIRAWSRVGFYAQLCLGLLAALGLSGITAWRRHYQILGAMAVLLVVMETLNGPFMTSSSAPRAVDQWLARQPGTSAIVQVPDISTGYNEYYSLFHKRPLAIGYGTFPPPKSNADRALLNDFPAPVAIAAMRRLEIGIVIVRRNLLDAQRPGWWRDADANQQIERAYVDDQYVAYRLRESTR
jgi:hypothetical protein